MYYKYKNIIIFVLNNTSHASHLNSAPGLVFDFKRDNLFYLKHEVH